MLKKKKTRPSVIYRLISGLFYRPSESDWKEKNGALSSLSISRIKDGSANTNLQGTYPPVIVHRLNCRATVSVCVESGILCVRVHVISDFALPPVHVPPCVSAPVYPSNASREN